MRSPSYIVAVLWAAAWLPVSLAASTTVVLNDSPAHQCYKAALRGDDDDGIDHCDAAIEHQALTRSDLASTYSNRGLLEARGGDLRSALKDHNRAVKLAPEVASVFINRANLYLRLRRFEEALNDLDEAVRLNDAVRHLAFYNRALLHQRLGNQEAAREDAEQAVALGPDIEAYSNYLKSLKLPEPVTATLKPTDPQGAKTPAPQQPTPPPARQR